MVQQMNRSGVRVRRWALLADEVRRRLEPAGAPPASSRAAVGQQLPPPSLVHRSPVAGGVARALGASALSIGEHIVGDIGALDPTTRAGEALLAHELTHVAYHSAPGRVDIQREVEESAAQRAEAAVLSESAEPPSPGAASTDLDELSDRLYHRIVQALLLEQERAAYVA